MILIFKKMNGLQTDTSSHTGFNIRTSLGLVVSQGVEKIRKHHELLELSSVITEFSDYILRFTKELISLLGKLWAGSWAGGANWRCWWEGATGRPLQSLRILAREGDNGPFGGRLHGLLEAMFSGRGGWMGQHALYTGQGSRSGGGAHRVPCKPVESTVFLQKGEGILNKREQLPEYSVLKQGGKGPAGLCPTGQDRGGWASSAVQAAETSPPRQVVKGEWEQLTDFLCWNPLAFPQVMGISVAFP